MAGVRAYIESGGKIGPKLNEKRDKKIRALAKGGMSWTEIADEVGVSKQTVYRVLRPNKAKEHRESDMTRYYKGKGKTPTSAKPPKRATFDDVGGQEKEE